MEFRKEEVIMINTNGEEDYNNFAVVVQQDDVNSDYTISIITIDKDDDKLIEDEEYPLGLVFDNEESIGKFQEEFISLIKKYRKNIIR